MKERDREMISIIFILLTHLVRESNPVSPRPILVNVCFEDIIFLRRPWTFLDTCFVTAWNSTHLWYYFIFVKLPIDIRIHLVSSFLPPNYRWSLISRNDDEIDEEDLITYRERQQTKKRRVVDGKFNYYDKKVHTHYFPIIIIIHLFVASIYIYIYIPS